MVATRVGYTGGERADPTYTDLGDHSEAIRVDFDPSVISYPELLEAFGAEHDPCGKPWSIQYRSAIFVHDDAQRAAADAFLARLARERGRPVFTAVEPAGTFTLAEAYHQKYRLRRDSELAREYEALYPELEDFVSSTAVTRVNAYLAGERGARHLDEELELLGLSAAGRERLKRAVAR